MSEEPGEQPQSEPAYPSILSRHFERQQREIGAVAQEEDKVEEGEPVQERSSTHVAQPIQVQPEQMPRRREEEKENIEGDKPNPYLEVENLQNSYGIDMDTVCDFWNSYKKQFVHLKDWHHKQKQEVSENRNTIHWHLQVLAHFHNSLMDNMNLSNMHSESVLSFFKSMMEHEKEYAAKMDKYAKNLMPKIKSHPKIEYRQNPSSTNPKDLIPVESAFNRFNLIFTQQQKELTQKKLEFVHFLKTRLCDNIKKINKDVNDRIQRYVPCFSKARKMLDQQEKEVQKSFDHLCVSFNNFESAIFRQEHEPAIQSYKQKIMKAQPKKGHLQKSLSAGDGKLNKNAIDIAAEAASKEAQDSAKNKTQRRVSGITSADGSIEEDIWLLERAYLFTVKIWHQELIGLSNLIMSFWSQSIEIELTRKGMFKEMAIEYFAKNKSQMMSNQGKYSEITDRLQKYITQLDTQNQVDLLYHHKSLITDESESCFNKFKLACGTPPQKIPSISILSKEQFKDELGRLKVQRAPRSGLIVTYGKLKRNPGIFSSWKVCTAAITRNNYLVLFDNENDRKPSLHLYLPHYALQNPQVATKQLGLTLIQYIKFNGPSKVTLRALSTTELSAWQNGMNSLCLSYQGT